MPFAMVKMSGTTSKSWKAKGAPAAEDARLYFVADHERVVFEGEASNGLHERFRHGVHAAFALNGLEHDRANVLAVFGEDALELVFVVRGAGEKAAGQGWKSFWRRSCMVAATVSSVRPWKLP